MKEPQDKSIEEIIDYGIELVLNKALEGDARSQYSMFSHMLYLSLEELNESRLDEAEDWLIKSAEQGYEKAVNYYKNSWEKVKSNQAMQIKNRLKKLNNDDE